MTRELVSVALGEQPADTVLLGGELINVHTGEIHRADIAAADGCIAIVGDVDRAVGPDTQQIDATGCFLVPGLIDAHLHTYETHLSIAHLAPAMLQRGVTTVATDFYGEAVVGGKEAVQVSLDVASNTPMRVLFTLPMPAYYQDRPFVHSGSLDEHDMREMLNWDACVAINECFAPYVASGDEFLMELMDRARQRGKALCGHGSETTGEPLMAWTAFGGYLDDHECVSAEEVVEKARLGIRIVLREGSGASDVRNCLAAITDHGLDARRFSFCSDLLSPVDLVKEGDIDRCVRYAIQAGVNPIEAVRMGSLNAAETLGVDRWLGALAPGKKADVCLVRGALEDFRITEVVAGGGLVVRDGVYVGPEPPLSYPASAWKTIRLPRSLRPIDFRISTETTHESQVRAIRVRNGSLITKEEIVRLPVKGGEISADPAQDVAKVASIERHGASGKVGLGFVKDFGIRSGAIASSYNPHCQHLLVLGVDDDDMTTAAMTVAEMGGGFSVVASGEILARVPLPIYGLLSDKGAAELVREIEQAIQATSKLGCELSAPFHTLAFLGLPVIIGELKICSEGLIDVWGQGVVPVEVGA